MCNAVERYLATLEDRRLTVLCITATLYLGQVCQDHDVSHWHSTCWTQAGMTLMTTSVECESLPPDLVHVAAVTTEVNTIETLH